MQTRLYGLNPTKLIIKSIFSFFFNSKHVEKNVKIKVYHKNTYSMKSPLHNQLLKIFKISLSTILDKTRWDTLPYGREKAASSPIPLFNVAIMLSRTYMLTYNIDLGDGERGKVALPN